MFPLYCSHTVSTSLLWDLVQVDDLSLGATPAWQAPRDNVNKHSIIRTWQSSLQFRSCYATSLLYSSLYRCVLFIHLLYVSEHKRRTVSKAEHTGGSQPSVSPPDLSNCSISLATITFNLCYNSLLNPAGVCFTWCLFSSTLLEAQQENS